VTKLVLGRERQVIIRRYSQAAAVVSTGIDLVPGLTAVVRISARRAIVGRLYAAREDDDDDAAGIEMAGCDAVTASVRGDCRD
jgi:hypothetical protein